MAKVRHRALMRSMRKRGMTYSQIAKWLKGSQTWGDGTYTYRKKCPKCGQYLKECGEHDTHTETSGKE